MASLRVLKNFHIAPGDTVRLLKPGAVYLAGDTLTGLTLAETAELLTLAPAGTFEAADKEAETAFDWLARKQAELIEDPTTKTIAVGGSIAPSGQTRIRKGGR